MPSNRKRTPTAYTNRKTAGMIFLSVHEESVNKIKSIFTRTLTIGGEEWFIEQGIFVGIVRREHERQDRRRVRAELVRKCRMVERTTRPPKKERRH